MNKIIWTMLISVVICSCYNVRSQPLKIIEATSQKYAGGAKGSGSGTRFKIKAVAKQSSSKFKIDKLWIGEDFFVPEVVKKSDITNTAFQKGDTILIVSEKKGRRENIPDRPPIIETDSIKKEPLPFPNKDAAGLISYTTSKGKRKYLKITAVKELPRMNFE